MKFLLVVGTRPEAVKMVPVMAALRRIPGNDVILRASGQHGEMLDIVLADFGLKQDIRLAPPPSAPDVSTLTAHLCHAFVWPVHRNPNVQSVVAAAFSSSRNVILLPPLSYESLLAILMRSRLALSDSGGIQEEAAPSFGVPVLVLRETTERPEGVTAGVAKLVGSDARRICKATTAILDGTASWSSVAANPYGDGHAGERIARLLAG